jgi:CBS domain containing-hemolysin-like protein
MTSLALIALGAALAALAARWHDLARVRLRRTHGAQVADVMSPDVPAISAQLTVEEVTYGTLGPTERPAYAVTDRDGHALGVLLREDLLRIPHTERPARLVGDVARAAVVDRSADLAEVLVRPGVAEAGTAVVVDAGRMPVGLLRLRDVQPPAVVVGDEPVAELAADARPS